MAKSSTTANRPVVAWLFILAGALFLLYLLIHLAVPHLVSTWFFFFADAALAIAFLFLFIGRSKSLILRAAWIVGAVGWAILAIENVAGLGSVVSILGIILALVGSLVAGILVFLRHVFNRRADLAFLLAMIFVALDLLQAWTGFLPGVIDLIVVIVYSVLLVVTGVVLQRRR